MTPNVSLALKEELRILHRRMAATNLRLAAINVGYSVAALDDNTLVDYLDKHEGQGIKGFERFCQEHGQPIPGMAVA